ncbi:Nucleotidyl transferase [Flavisolibacter ginsengisoli DSM 18119]|uniref:Nucleotidyl transferase n=2 Tax=Flavisolibacter TaxID=398041 RepID=A0A1M4VDA5_9BACT|nr:Nucleotidyl transferase [Flavisolibacter ginsengisoli DSM 18119]
MKAMIFCAGLGTRFKPWTDTHPKALAIVNGKSLLQRNVEYLQKYDIMDFVVNVHHFADQIIDAIDKSKGWGSNITISDEKDEVLETGGGLMKARKFLEGDAFLTINVDILTDANLKYFLATHQQENSLITLAITNRKTSRYLLFNKYNRLCGWRNIQTREERIALEAKDMFEKAYSGLAIFEPGVFDLITLQHKFSLIDVYLSLAHDNKIAGFDHSESKFLDVGKPESVELAERLFE